MKFFLAIVASILAVFPSHAERIPFNKNWQFALADTVSASTQWKDIVLPHDWSVAGRFDRNAPAGNDVARMVRRDRNHPSVFCRSIGNEIIERKSPQAAKDAAMLAEVCRSIDPTRPVTQALASWDSDWEIYDPLAAEHDIVGYNYMIHKAESDHERVPGRVMMQTESYPRDAWKNYRMAADHPYIIGDFVWTGLDYLGESGIGRWYYEGDVPGEHYHRPLFPWHAAYCGDVDLTGLRKPISHYRSMLWNADDRLAVITDGPVELIALGNADIKDNEPYFDNTQKTWHGRALAVVRSTGKGGTGTITVATPSLSKNLEIKCSHSLLPEGPER